MSETPEPSSDPPMDTTRPPACRECDDAGCPACNAEAAEAPAPTVYRCGWCGWPTDAEGEPIAENPEGYLARYPDAEEKMVQGRCCPNGNEPEPRMMQVTRDMAGKIFELLDRWTPEQRAEVFYHLEHHWCWDCGRPQSEEHPDCAPRGPTREQVEALRKDADVYNSNIEEMRNRGYNRAIDDVLRLFEGVAAETRE